MIKPIFILAFLLCSLVSFSNTENDTIHIVATVNGEPIVLKELKLIEQQNKTTSDLSFHNEKAIENAILIKLQQQLGKQLKLVDDISYSGFQKDFSAENNRRLLALKRNELFYGPTRLTEENYYNYRLTNLVIGIKKTLAEKEFNVSEQNLKTFYESIKDSLFKLPDYLKVQRFEIYFNNKTETNHQPEIIRKIQSLLNTKKFNLIELNNRFKNVAEIKSHIQVFDSSDTEKMEGEERAEVENQIANIKAGQFSLISKQNISFCFYQILQQISMGHRNFESVKNSVKARYIDILYNKYLTEIREKAIIVRYLQFN